MHGSTIYINIYIYTLCIHKSICIYKPLCRIIHILLHLRITVYIIIGCALNVDSLGFAAKSHQPLTSSFTAAPI